MNTLPSQLEYIPRGTEQHVLLANPGWYDYIHMLRMSHGGRFEMVDGGGQVVNFMARGGYEFVWVDNQHGLLHLRNVAHYQPYRKSLLGALPDVTVPVTREAGTFAFRLEVEKTDDSGNQNDCWVFSEKYVFEIDPLQPSSQYQRGNLYNITENRDFTESVKTYYDRLSARLDRCSSLEANGITVR